MVKSKPLTTDDLERQMSFLKCAFPPTIQGAISLSNILLEATGVSAQTFNAWKCLAIFINTFAEEPEKRHWMEVLQTWWHLENKGKPV